MARIESEFTIKDSASGILDKIAKRAEKVDQRIENAMRMARISGQSASRGFREVYTAMEMGQAGINGWSTAFRGLKDIGSATFNALKSGISMMSVGIEGVKSGISLLGMTIKALPNSIQSVANDLMELSNIAMNLGSAIKEVYSYGDKQRSMEYRIKVFSDKKYEYDTDNLRKDLTKNALESYTSVEDISSLTSGVMISGATQGNIDRSIQLAKNISKAMVATGATSEEAQRSVLQLKQALSSGILQGDELRSIREQTPGVMIALANGIKKMAKVGELPKKYINTTMGDLKQLGKDGLLTSDLVVRAFEQGAGSIDKIFKNMPVTFDRVSTQAGTIFKNMWAKITDPGSVFGSIQKKLLKMMNNLAKVIDTPEFEAFFEGINRGLAPLYAIIEMIINGINSLVDGIDGSRESIEKFGDAGEIVGTVLLTIIGLIIAKLAILATQAVIASAPILAVVGVFAGIGAIIQSLEGDSLDLKGILAGVGKAGTLAGIGLVTMFNVAIGVIQSLNVLLRTTVSLLDGMAKTLWGVAEGIIGEIGKEIGDGLYDTWVQIDNSFGGDLQTIEEMGGSANKFYDIAEEGWKTAESGLQEDYDALTNGGKDLSEIISKTVDDTGKVWEAGVEAFNNMDESVNTLLNKFSSIGSGFSSLADVGKTVKPPGMPESEWKKMQKNNATTGSTDYDKTLEKIYKQFENSSKKTNRNLGGISRNTGATARNTANKEVNLAKQDIEYLKSVAARDFMVNVNTKAPKITNTFGDVKETADVNAILNAITDAVENQLAVSLVR